MLTQYSHKVEVLVNLPHIIYPIVLLYRCIPENTTMAWVNGIKDVKGQDMPFLENGIWEIQIDINTGLIIDWPIGSFARVKYKTDNRNYYELSDEEGYMYSRRGFVIQALSKKRTILNLNINANGQILNYKKTFNDYFEPFEGKNTNDLMLS